MLQIIIWKRLNLPRIPSVSANGGLILPVKVEIAHGKNSRQHYTYRGLKTANFNGLLNSEEQRGD